MKRSASFSLARPALLLVVLALAAPALSGCTMFTDPDEYVEGGQSTGNDTNGASDTTTGVDTLITGVDTLLTDA